MGNDYFCFKQFKISQAKTAMKVCTDSCLFGALLPIINKVAIQVLDIGTGTGLLSLMYAQMNQVAQIEALELDRAAFEQAQENFREGPWPERMKATLGDFRLFAKGQQASDRSYDLIFSNPPFFEGDLKSGDNQRNKALHSTELNFKDLVGGVTSILREDGLFAVLIPFARTAEFIGIAAEFGLFPGYHYKVANAAGKAYFRSILVFSRKRAEVQEEEILIRELIKESKLEYSLKFRALLRPFYLYL